MEMTTEKLLRFYGWSKNPNIEECAKKAYHDLNRTMNYKKPNDTKDEKSEFEKEKDEYKQQIYKVIGEKITELFNKSKVKKEDFENWHKETCRSIRKESNSYNVIEEFHYGHAQKWLNMTIKNMLIAGVEVANAKQKIGDLESFFHVPIDQFIMKVVSRDYEIKLPLKQDKEDPPEYGEYHYKVTRGKNKGKDTYNQGDKFICWSKWDETQYGKVQNELKEKIKINEGIESPLEWEFKVWIKERDGEEL